MPDLIAWGLAGVQWVQTFRNPFFDNFFFAINLLGETNFYVATIPLLYWCIHKQIGRRYGLLIISSMYLNLSLKDFFAQPRPYQVDPNLYVPYKEPRFGIPSFHAHGTTVTWGYLATQFKTRGWWALAVAIPLLVSIGRMYVGVHFPQDAIAGVAIGLGSFVAYAAFEPRVGEWLNTRASLAIKVAIAIIVPFALAAIHLTSDTGAAAGTLLGISVGFALEEEFVRFDTPGAVWKQVAKIAIGFIVLLALQESIKVFLPDAGANNFVRYASVGLWLALGAPWVFVRTRLAQASAD